MSAISVRDAPFGQLCRLILGPRVFLYPDEKDGFHYSVEERQTAPPTPESNGSTDTNADVEKAESGQAKDGYQAVGWYNESDTENPQMWSVAKKTVTFFQICLLTFAGSSPTDLLSILLTGY
jgi:DHA1 family multidrug resistance protein-like MFS transporter